MREKRKTPDASAAAVLTQTIWTSLSWTVLPDISECYNFHKVLREGDLSSESELQSMGPFPVPDLLPLSLSPSLSSSNCVTSPISRAMVACLQTSLDGPTN